MAVVLSFNYNIVRIFVCVTLGVGALSACDSVPKSFSNNAPQVVAAPDAVSARLAEAADKASASLQTLAAVENARSKKPAISAVENAPPELMRAMTVNWVGPVEPIVKSLAQRAGYDFQTFGGPPPNVVVVSIDAENQPIIEIMRNIGLQLGNRANVKVNGKMRSVELYYAPVDSGSPRGIGG
jgi:defect-in-organelle-trafficking protein DotD